MWTLNVACVPMMPLNFLRHGRRTTSRQKSWMLIIKLKFTRQYRKASWQRAGRRGTCGGCVALLTPPISKTRSEGTPPPPPSTSLLLQHPQAMACQLTSIAAADLPSPGDCTAAVGIVILMLVRILARRLLNLRAWRRAGRRGTCRSRLPQRRAQALQLSLVRA